MCEGEGEGVLGYLVEKELSPGRWAVLCRNAVCVLVWVGGCLRVHEILSRIFCPM